MRTDSSPDGHSKAFTRGVILPLMVEHKTRKPNEPVTDFPNRLREQRRARGLSQKQLAAMTGQKPQSVARHETGLNQITLAQMEVYGRALGVKPEELLNDSQRIDERLRPVLDMFSTLAAPEQERFIRLSALFDPAASYSPQAIEAPAGARKPSRRK